jgi:tetratricopeptide (TPR) repeat protein
MASLAAPPLTESRPDISKEAIPHVIDFLRDEKPSVRQRAVQGLLTHSLYPDGHLTLLTARSTKNKRVVEELCRLVGDIHDIAPKVLSVLINLSSHDMGLDQMLASPNLVDQLMENLSLKHCNYKRLTLMLVSNLTRSYQGAAMFMSTDVERKDLHGFNVLRLVRWFLENPATIQTEDPVVSEKEELSQTQTQVIDDDQKHDTWEFIAGILANLTRVKTGRDFVIDWQRGLLRPLILHLRSPSVLRRRGIARMLRNICNEFDHHKRLLDDVMDGGIDLVHVALLSLSNGDLDTNLGDHEKDASHSELFSKHQRREKDLVVRKKICEMLVVLTRTYYGRELMRARKVYPIVREMHSDTTQMVQTLRRRRGEQVNDDDDDDATPFDEVIFTLVDHIAAEEKVVEEGEEDVIEEVEAGTTAVKGSGREYEVGFSYTPGQFWPKNNENKDNDDSDDEEDEDVIFSSKLANAADSSEDEDNSSSSDDENKTENNSVFTVKTLTMEEREKKAFEFKEKGNAFYKNSQFKKAIECYKKAREWLPPPRLTAICYSNESASNGGLGEWKKAEECALKCINEDPHFTKGFIRHSKALEKQHLYAKAIETLTNGVDNLRGKNMKKLHPIHVRGIEWPSWLNDGIALLEKNIVDLKAKEVKYNEKKAAKAATSAKRAVQNAEKVAQKVNQENVSTIPKSTMNNTGDLTDQQKKEVMTVINQRKDFVRFCSINH